MSDNVIFIGDVFTVPHFDYEEWWGWSEERIAKARKEFLKKLSRILQVQVLAFRLKSGQSNLFPDNCYVSSDEESLDIALALPLAISKELQSGAAGLGIVTYSDLSPVKLEPGQAVFTYNW